VDHHPRLPEVRYTLTTINTGAAQGKTNASIYIRLVDRKQRARSAERCRPSCASACARCRHHRHPGGPAGAGGRAKADRVLAAGPDQAELERLAAPLMERLRAIPGLVDLDTSSKPDKPTLDIVVKREAASELGLSTAQIATPLRTLVAGRRWATGARPTTRPTTWWCAWRPSCAPRPATWSACRSPLA
jgi:HAE1 family hydrophobic/amphiphilic exporter-1